MRLSNVPIPQAHVAALVGAAGLHFVLPLRLPLSARAGRLLGGPMLAFGIGLAAWAVDSAGDTNVERDEALITDGAYAASRNPMYAGWSVAVLGLALWTRSAWLLGASLVAIQALDREVRDEESRLAQRFGTGYREYRERVPRW